MDLNVTRSDDEGSDVELIRTPAPRSSACRPLGPLFSFFRGVQRFAGIRYIFYVASTQLLLTGIAYQTSLIAVLPFFKDKFGLEVAETQLFAAIAYLPWTMKPLMGLACDFISLCGYSKRWYHVSSAVIGIAGCVALFVLGNKVSVLIAFFLVNYECSFSDLIFEGGLSELIRQKPESGGAIVVCAQALQHLGGIVAATAVGLSAGHTHLSLIVSSVLIVTCSLPLFPGLLGWIPEDRKGRRLCLVHRPCSKEVSVILFCGMLAPIVALVSVFVPSQPIYGMLIGFFGVVVILLGTRKFFPRSVFNMALCNTIFLLSKPSLTYALGYFYTSSCVHDGPHFSYSFYLTVTQIVSFVAAFAGTWVYQLIFSDWTYRRVLLVTGFLWGVGGVFDLLTVLRWNMRIGIPDEAMVLFGDGVFESLVTSLNYICAMAYTAKIVPVGLETSTFALLVGISNTCESLRQLLGRATYGLAGIEESTCSFSKLWILILTLNVILPVLGGAGSAFLVPDVAQQSFRVMED